MPLLLMLVKLLLLFLIVTLKVNISHIYLCRQNAIFFNSVSISYYDSPHLWLAPHKFVATHFSRCNSSNLLTDQWACKILFRILKHQTMIKVCHKVPNHTRIKFLHSLQNLELFLGTCVSLHTLDCRKRGHVFYVIMDSSSRSRGRRRGEHSRGGEACLLVSSLPLLAPG